jgi:hypothetical protein
MNCKHHKSYLSGTSKRARQLLSTKESAFLLPLRFPEWMAMPSQRPAKYRGFAGFSHIFIFCILFLFLVNLSFLTHAQEISNIRVTQTGNNVNVLYDLAGEGQTFKVNLFYSVDNGQTWKGPLRPVSGDAGLQIKPGTNKKITWDVQSEPGVEEGYMQFKVVAETTEMPFQEKAESKPAQIPDLQLRKYKTGKTISLTLALASAGTGIYSYLQGNKLYDEYQTATNDAADLRSKVELYDKIYPVAFAVAGASTVSFIVYSTKHGKAKKELTFQPVPLSGGAGLAVSLRF